MSGAEAFKTTLFGSIERLIGKPENHDLVSIILGKEDSPRPFGISHTPDLEQGFRSYTIARYDGDKDIVWMGVNHNPHSGRSIDDVRGLFSVDRTKQRVLFDPTDVIPIRDSYRAFYQRSFGFTGKLADLLSIIEESGIPFYQIAPVQTVLLRAQRQGILSPEETIKKGTEVDLLYRKETGRILMPKPFQVEGPVSLAQIKEGRNLPVTLFNANVSFEEYKQKLVSNW